MRRLRKPTWIMAVLLIMLLNSQVAPVLANRPVQNLQGLRIDGAFLELHATPGQVYVHQITITSRADTPPMDIQVEADGFGESLSGVFLALPDTQDASPFSGRSFITNIDKPSFHLSSGSAVTVSVTISIPEDIGSDTHYAIIYIYGQKSDSAGVVNYTVPVIITPVGAQFNFTGTIRELKIGPVKNDQPFRVQAIVTNTGNRHFKVKGHATLADSADNILAETDLPLTSSSIIPLFAERLEGMLAPGETLAAGVYTVTVKATQEDGTLVDERQGTFKIAQSKEKTHTPGPSATATPTATYTSKYIGPVTKTSTPTKTLVSGSGTTTATILPAATVIVINESATPTQKSVGKTPQKTSTPRPAQWFSGAFFGTTTCWLSLLLLIILILILDIWLYFSRERNQSERGKVVKGKQTLVKEK